MALRLIPRSLRRSGFLVTVPGVMRSIIARLTPASRHQDHAALSSASGAFVGCATCGHRLPRPTSVTIAKRPSWWARDARQHAFDLPDVTSEMACGTMTRRANQLPRRKTCQAQSSHVPDAARHEMTRRRSGTQATRMIFMDPGSAAHRKRAQHPGNVAREPTLSFRGAKRVSYDAQLRT